MNKIALDIGTKRIGICLYIEKILLPQKNIKTEELKNYLNEIIHEFNISEIIVGVPLNRKGEETNMSKWIRTFVNKLKISNNIKINFHNEFLSSIEAERKIKTEIGKKRYKEKVDSMSACIILENYINEKSKNE